MTISLLTPELKGLTALVERGAPALESILVDLESTGEESDRLLSIMLHAAASAAERIGDAAWGADVAATDVAQAVSRPWAGWIDAAVCEPYALPYAAQVALSELPVALPGETTEDWIARARATLTATNRPWRGTAGAIKAAVRPFLTGTKAVKVVFAPDGNLWRVQVRVRSDEVTDEAALAAAIDGTLQQLVANGNFADGITGWESNDSVGITNLTGNGISTMPDGSGDAAWRHHGSNGSATHKVSGYRQDDPYTAWIPVTPGDLLYARVDAWSATSTAVLAFQVDWHDASGALRSLNRVGAVWQTGPSGWVTGQRRTALFPELTAPASAAYARPQTQISSSLVETFDVYTTGLRVANAPVTAYADQITGRRPRSTANVLRAGMNADVVLVEPGSAWTIGEMETTYASRTIADLESDFASLTLLESNPGGL